MTEKQNNRITVLGVFIIICIFGYALYKVIDNVF
jgi:hypothetical protein